ncbi:MAG: thiol:disulfide interchange protein DsbA/DsbL [Marinobacter sp.]|nr:thiol:disulfide interchange protein DsbA/DsbL [Marinobacter sp.]
MRGFLAAWVLVLVALPMTAVADARWQAGTHYQVLSTPLSTRNPDRIEVTEIFWYGCPHCLTFKPYIEAWAANKPDDVDYVKLPAVFSRGWEPHARAFYAVEAMGAIEQAHTPLFEGLARDRRNLDNADRLAAFLANHGVNADEFKRNYNSFGVNARLQQGNARIRGAQVNGVPAIQGTPSVMVNGKYVTSPSIAGSREASIEVMRYLIDKERAAN